MPWSSIPTTTSPWRLLPWNLELRSKPFARTLSQQAFKRDAAGVRIPTCRAATTAKKTSPVEADRCPDVPSCAEGLWSAQTPTVLERRPVSRRAAGGPWVAGLPAAPHQKQVQTQEAPACSGSRPCRRTDRPRVLTQGAGGHRDDARALFAGHSARMRRVASSPSMPGIWTSIRITS